MRLQDVAVIATRFPDADFWVVRRGSLKSVGEPTYTFNPEHIGIKVFRGSKRESQKIPSFRMMKIQSTPRLT